MSFQLNEQDEQTGLPAAAAGNAHRVVLVPLWCLLLGQLAPQASLNRVGCTTVVGIYFWDFGFFLVNQ
jgi:hypothetical protein